LATNRASSSNAVEQTLFVRKASGLVKGWDTGDGFRYSWFAVNLFLGIWGFAYATFVPGGSVFWAVVITTAIVLLEVVVYAALISVMPRAGGDYIWQSRLLASPVGFVLAITGWVFILWQWIPIYAALFVNMFLVPILRIVGAGGAADWLLTKNGVFVSSLATIVVASVLVAVGMKSYAKFQKWCWRIGLVALAVAGIILLVKTRSDFVVAFNRESLELYGAKNAYAATLANSGAGMPSSMFSGSVWDTLRLVPFMIFWLIWPNWGATLYGEVRGAKNFRSNIYQMGGGLLVAVAMGMAFLALISKTMGYHFFMAAANGYEGVVYGYLQSTPHHGEYLSPVAMTSWLINSPAFQVVLLVCMIPLILAWWGTVFLSSTRVVFAAAFDRILPDKMASVTSGGVPWAALLLMALPSIVTSALYAYTSWFVELTYDAMLVITLTYMASGVAFMIMPWRARQLWEASPVPKARVAGIPVMSLVAAAFVGFFVFNVTMWVKDAVYGVNNTKSFYFMGTLYLIAIAVWVVAWLVRKRQGMSLETVAKQIPVE